MGYLIMLGGAVHLPTAPVSIDCDVGRISWFWDMVATDGQTLNSEVGVKESRCTLIYFGFSWGNCDACLDLDRVKYS